MALNKISKFREEFAKAEKQEKLFKELPDVNASSNIDKPTLPRTEIRVIKADRIIESGPPNRNPQNQNRAIPRPIIQVVVKI
jgi:hypothetical protein